MFWSIGKHLSDSKDDIHSTVGRQLGCGPSMQNLAAMGAQPLGITVGLSLSPEFLWCELGIPDQPLHGQAGLLDAVWN